MGIKLAEDTISAEDIKALCEWLPTAKKLTQGDLVLEFEKTFTDIIGSKATFVNSGSSALLLAFWSLIETGKLKRGDKVAIPAICWSTDLSPLIQFGLEPVVIDVNYEYGMSYKNFLEELSRSNIKCLLYVYVLGLMAESVEIIDMCREKNIIVIEDCCESLGSRRDYWKSEIVGSYGDISVFSTFYSHHISTIEGGFICTNDEDLYKNIRQIRNHGWIRDEEWKEDAMKKYGVSEFDMNYTFFSAGFNVRNTEVAAFLGLRQVEKFRLHSMLEIRNKNYKLWQGIQLGYLYEPAFGLPLTCSICVDKESIIKKLKDNNIECRPMIAGNIVNQPVFKKNFGYKYLEVAEYIHKNSIYLPNHHKVTADDINTMREICKK